jgi:hypothetical protein
MATVADGIARRPTFPAAFISCSEHRRIAGFLRRCTLNYTGYTGGAVIDFGTIQPSAGELGRCPRPPYWVSINSKPRSTVLYLVNCIQLLQTLHFSSFEHLLAGIVEFTM